MKSRRSSLSELALDHVDFCYMRFCKSNISGLMAGLGEKWECAVHRVGDAMLPSVIHRAKLHCAVRTAVTGTTWLTRYLQ
jgi:hypothetical protein